MAKILIVDDNRMLLQALSDHLEEMGYETEVASTGVAALEVLDSFNPDLIIMDLVMPEMGGIEATQHIRQKPEIKSIPVVAFTSQSDQGQWDDLFDDYLIKPFGFDDLKKIVEKFLTPQQDEDFF